MEKEGNMRRVTNEKIEKSGDSNWKRENKKITHKNKRKIGLRNE